MEQYDINGVSVKFPFDPYPVQRKYMEKVIESIENKQNALLESPTGTGKTLSLLCATLAWIEKRDGKGTTEIQFVPETAEQTGDESKAESLLNVLNKVGKRNIKPGHINPKVIYTSRTHSQILQAMNEQKRTEYNYINAAVLASRNQLCVNPELKMKSNSDKSYNCKSLVKKEACTYYTNVDSALKEPEMKQTIIDIEDLDRIGKKFDCCPYFVSKEVLQKAQVIYMPYNYLIDPKIRRGVKIDFSDSIVIIDEAHNINSVCEQCASTAITSTNVGIAVRDIKYILNQISDKMAEEHMFTVKEVNMLASSVYALDMTINDMQMDSFGKHPGSYIFELLKEAKITEGNSLWFTDLLNKLIQFLADNSRVLQKCPAGKGLSAILQFLETIFSNSVESIKERVDQCYKVHIKCDTTQQKTTIIVDLWCFSPAIMMKHLLQKNIRCLILTSGTLSPLQALAAEMEIPFPVQLSNPHIIQKTQVCVKIVSHGVGNELLDSCYKNRLNQKYISSLGFTIAEFAKTVPDGLLVFFPSYSFMEKLISTWRAQNIWTEMLKHKPIFLEPDTKEKLKMTMNEYYAKINQKKGAIFMAVLRGKVSEGLDFADMYGRGVIITGIPFAPCKEPKVLLKQKYLDDNLSRGHQMISGREWYGLDAIRAVNQAIGRVIRHKDDYGAILLCDHRFRQNIQHISTWVKNNLDNRPSNSFDRTIEELSAFFNTAENTLPKPKIKLKLEESMDDDDDEMFNCTYHPTQFLTDTLNTSNNNGSTSDEDSTSSGSSAYESDHKKPSASSARKRKVSISWQSDGAARVKSEPSTSRAIDSDSDEAQVKVNRERKEMKFKKEPKEEPEESSPNKANENSIMSFLEHILDSTKYKELVKCQIKYNSDGLYKCCRDSLFNIFREDHLVINLKGMSLLLKPNHQDIFKIDVEVFMQSRRP